MDQAARGKRCGETALEPLGPPTLKVVLRSVGLGGVRAEARIRRRSRGFIPRWCQDDGWFNRSADAYKQKSPGLAGLLLRVLRRSVLRDHRSAPAEPIVDAGLDGVNIGAEGNAAWHERG
jgi:hypothetical protein